MLLFGVTHFVIEDCELHDVCDLLTRRLVQGIGPNGGPLSYVTLADGSGRRSLIESQATFTHVAIELKLPDGHWKGEVAVAQAPQELDGHGHTCFFAISWVMQHIFGRYKDSKVYKAMRHWRAALVRFNLDPQHIQESKTLPTN